MTQHTDSSCGRPISVSPSDPLNPFDLVCSFQGLQHLLQLEDLLLDHNELRDVAGLGDCKKLLGLHASDNHITTLAGLKGLQALEVGPRACICNTGRHGGVAAFLGIAALLSTK